MVLTWIQHSDEHLAAGSPEWQIAGELAPDPAEPHVEKHYSDAFESTELEARLAELGVGRLLVTGAQTDQCIRGTLHGGLFRGYDTVLVSDAHTTEDLTGYGAPPPADVIAHTNLYWTYEAAPGRTGGILTTADIDFSAAG